MAKVLAVMLTGLLVVSGVGCATIVAGGPDFVPVNSNPAGANVKRDGIPMGKTPLVVPFDRSCEGVLTFDLEGYERQVVDVDKVVNGWFFGNLLWFPVFPVIPVGMVVDICASNQGRYSTAPLHVELKPLSRSPEAGKP